MKAVIVCGGQGTRIRDVSENISKPMLESLRSPQVSDHPGDEAAAPFETTPMRAPARGGR